MFLFYETKISIVIIESSCNAASIIGTLLRADLLYRVLGHFFLFLCFCMYLKYDELNSLLDAGKDKTDVRYASELSVYRISIR